MHTSVLFNTQTLVTLTCMYFVATLWAWASFQGDLRVYQINNLIHK